MSLTNCTISAESLKNQQKIANKSDFCVKNAEVPEKSETWDRSSAKARAEESTYVPPKNSFLIPTIPETARDVLEKIPSICKHNSRGYYFSGKSYAELAKRYNRLVPKEKHLSPWQMKRAITELRKAGLIIHRKELWEDSLKFKDHIITLPWAYNHFRVKKRSKNRMPQESDLIRWNLSFSENRLHCGREILLLLLKPYVGRGKLLTKTEAKLLNHLFKLLHSENALRDQNGVRHVKINYQDLEKACLCDKSTVYRFLAKLREHGALPGEIITDKYSKHACKITIDFAKLAEYLENNEEIAALDILAREKNPGKRIVWGGQPCGYECEQNSGVVENEALELVQYLYINNKVNIKEKTASQHVPRRTLGLAIDKKSVSAPPQPTSKHVTEMKNRKIFDSEFEKISPRVILKAVPALASERFKEWLGVGGPDKIWPLSEGTIKDFPVDDFVDFVWGVIDKAGGQDKLWPLFEGALVPDSRLEQQWLAIRFGIHCVNFLGMEKFLCVHAVNNRRNGLFVVEFFDDSPRPEVGVSIQDRARAALKDLHPKKKLFSEERFKKLFKAKIRRQLRAPFEPAWREAWIAKKARISRLEKEMCPTEKLKKLKKEMFPPEKLKKLKKENPEFSV